MGINYPYTLCTLLDVNLDMKSLHIFEVYLQFTSTPLRLLYDIYYKYTNDVVQGHAYLSAESSFSIKSSRKNKVTELEESITVIFYAIYKYPRLRVQVDILKVLIDVFNIINCQALKWKQHLRWRDVLVSELLHVQWRPIDNYRQRKKKNVWAVTRTVYF